MTAPCRLSIHTRCALQFSVNGKRMQHGEDITKLLDLARQGDRLAEERLMEALYIELRRIAIACLRSERKDHTLQPTALVHEAYLKLASQRDKQWHNRGHFLAVAAQAMRRVLVDCARTRCAKKRGGEAFRVDFDSNLAIANDWAEELLDVDRALTRLAEMDERQAKIVQMRFFAGLSECEIARLLGISERTVKRDWECAKAWLEGELQGQATPRARHSPAAKTAVSE
jgi:RNA polymerase sigma-70 factor, ECF subfamily